MNPWHLHLAVRVLRRGGLVLHATEGVWGIACDPWSPETVQRLLTLKQRDVGKGLIVMAADADTFRAELDALPVSDRRRILDSWPGAVTWVVPNRQFPAWITGGRDTVALRVSGHPQARALCRRWGGALVTTSANRSGRPPPCNAVQARACWRDLRTAGAAMDVEVHLLPGETLGRGGPSEIRTLTGCRLRVGPGREAR